MKKNILLGIILFFIPLFVFAEDITSNSKITILKKEYNKLTDKNENTYINISKDNSIKITSNNDIYGIYIIYELSSKQGTISNYTREIEIGMDNYLHEYINVEDLIGHSKELELKYNEDVKIGEIYVLGKGELPQYVEVWNPPHKEADLLLFSTHSDDEQLFFAGLMPTYIARGAKIQVVYFTNHNDNPKRLHEQIHGLYVIGIRNYPIIGFIPDAWSDNLKWAILNLKKSGFTEDDALKFEVEMIRRFKPQVIVGHDENGEYSHGQHILNTYILKSAILKSNDKEYDEESLNRYGLWDTPKTYLHLYKDNKVVLDYDTPLDYYNGKTAYEISKLGYKEHHTQQYTWFTKWLTGVDQNGKGELFSKSTEITKYSPREYGLYRSTVGNDINKNDLFENISIKIDVKKDDEKSDVNNNIENNTKTRNIKKWYYILPFSAAVILLLFIIIKKKKVK